MKTNSLASWHQRYTGPLIPSVEVQGNVPRVRSFWNRQLQRTADFLKMCSTENISQQKRDQIEQELFQWIPRQKTLPSESTTKDVQNDLSINPLTQRSSDVLAKGKFLADNILSSHATVEENISETKQRNSSQKHSGHKHRRRSTSIKLSNLITSSSAKSCKRGRSQLKHKRHSSMHHPKTKDTDSFRTHALLKYITHEAALGSQPLNEKIPSQVEAAKSNRNNMCSHSTFPFLIAREPGQLPNSLSSSNIIQKLNPSQQRSFQDPLISSSESHNTDALHATTQTNIFPVAQNCFSLTNSWYDSFVHTSQTNPLVVKNNHTLVHTSVNHHLKSPA